MRVAALATTLAVAAAPVAANSIDGWGKVKFGMTRDQVVAALDGRAGINQYGHITSYTEIGQESAVVDVRFDGMVADLVTLQISTPSLTRAECHKKLPGIVASLSAKYGAGADGEGSNPVENYITWTRAFPDGSEVGAEAASRSSGDDPGPCRLWVRYRDKPRTAKGTF